MAQTIAMPMLVADRDTLFRDGLVELLSENGFRPLAQRDGLEGAEAALRLNEAALLLVVYDRTGARLAARLDALRSSLPELRIALICDDADLADVALHCASAADSVLTKNVSSERLVRILELTRLGQRILPNDWIDRALQAIDRPSLPCRAGGRADGHAGGPAAPETGGACDAPAPDLTRREGSIADCLARGLPNKLIARELGIAEPTVKVHVKALLRKLGVRNRTQAAVWAVERGLRCKAGAPDADRGAANARGADRAAPARAAAGPGAGWGAAVQ